MPGEAAGCEQVWLIVECVIPGIFVSSSSPRIKAEFCHYVVRGIYNVCDAAEVVAQQVEVLYVAALLNGKYGGSVCIAAYPDKPPSRSSHGGKLWFAAGQQYRCIKNLQSQIANLQSQITRATLTQFLNTQFYSKSVLFNSNIMILLNSHSICFSFLICSISLT